MFIEIDSTEIIAYYASLAKQQKELTLSYQIIIDTCRKLEEQSRKILACYDMVSIDAFRCVFPEHVTMGIQQIVIRNLKEIQRSLQRFEPSEEIKRMIANIKIEEDEKNT